MFYAHALFQILKKDLFNHAAGLLPRHPSGKQMQ